MAKQLFMQLEETHKPRILVLCNGKFALPAIQILGIEKYLCGIGIGDADKSFSFLLKKHCEQIALPFRKFGTTKEANKIDGWLKKLKPDFVFSICFPFRLSEKVLAYKPNAFLNFHTGPLPSYRGPSPIFEVIKNREKFTALTVHYMVEEFDEGPVIVEEKIPVSDEDTFGSLAVRLSEMAGFTAKNIANMLEFATYIPSTPQEKHVVRYFESPSERDIQVKWEYMSASDIEALVRACNPWKMGAETIVDGRLIRFIHVDLTTQKHTTFPGRSLGMDERGRWIVSCKDQDCIAVTILQTDKGICTGDSYFKEQVSRGYWKNVNLLVEQERI